MDQTKDLITDFIIDNKQYIGYITITIFFKVIYGLFNIRSVVRKELEFDIIKDEVEKVKNENMILRIRLEDLERINFKIDSEPCESESESESVESTAALQPIQRSGTAALQMSTQLELEKLNNVIKNLALYTQKKTIGPHNVNQFIKILEKDYSEELEELFDNEFENFKIEHVTRSKVNTFMYNPNITELMNKQRMWVGSEISNIIFLELRSKFDPITGVYDIGSDFDSDCIDSE